MKLKEILTILRCGLILASYGDADSSSNGKMCCLPWANISFAPRRYIVYSRKVSRLPVTSSISLPFNFSTLQLFVKAMSQYSIIS